MKWWQILLFGLFLAGFMLYAIWSLTAFFTYPCDAFKTGYLSTGYAPGRCVK